MYKLEFEKIQDTKSAMDYLLMSTISLLESANESIAVGLQQAWKILSAQMDKDISALVSGHDDVPDQSEKKTV